MGEDTGEKMEARKTYWSSIQSSTHYPLIKPISSKIMVTSRVGLDPYLRDHLVTEQEKETGIKFLAQPLAVAMRSFAVSSHIVFVRLRWLSWQIVMWQTI